MLCYNFKDYAGFKERFGIVEHGNGEKSRKNKILLAYIKQPSLFKQASETGDYSLINIASMSELKQTILERVQQSGCDDENLQHKVQLINYTFYSSKYETDEFNGVCQDVDVKCCRYKNSNNGRTYKMKAGKFLQALILETEFGKTLPEQVLVYLMEEFATDFQSYSSSTLIEYKLCVNKDFSRIYSSYHCLGDFGSCMVDRGHHYFYEDAIDASAAYLENKDGNVVARCIVYNKVYDETGKIWRLAERQYSIGSDAKLKRALIDALIREKLIDGYKTVGAGCGDATSYEDINRNSLSGKKFRLECDLDCDDTLSYQDSFKWYDMDKRIAYNYPEDGADYGLDTTDLNLYGDCDDDDDDDDEPQEYDSYHQRNAWEVCTVWVHGQRESCDINNLDDFLYIKSLGQYHHYEDVVCCDECGTNELEDNAVYSEITKEYYCCEACRDAAEKKFKEENWYYSDFDQDYYEFDNEIARFYTWDEAKQFYVAKTISTSSLEAKIDDGSFIEFDGDYYPTIETDNAGVPFYLRREVLYAVA